MAGVAAGLALSGKKVYTYSIVNFGVTRCLEQIRNDICYHGADVTVVVVGGGVPYGTQGYTHFGVEDVAFMRALPGMDVMLPADRRELEGCLRSRQGKRGPAYLRLARGGEADIHPGPVDAEGLIELLPPQAVTVVASGTILGEARKAVLALQARGMEVGLCSLPRLSTMAEHGLLALGRRCRTVVTVEEHLARGGSGGFVAECLAAVEGRPRVLRLGLEHGQLKKIGGQDYLRKRNGIDAASLEATLEGLLAGVGGV
jgi:transketolase